MNDMKQEVQHAPGPWEVLPLKGKYYHTDVRLGPNANAPEVQVFVHDEAYLVSPREVERGQTYVSDHTENAVTLATARLIAAAPELLEAADEALRGLRILHDVGGNHGRPCMVCAAGAAVERAIAKATGGAA